MSANILDVILSFKCATCGESYSSSGDLAAHALMHTDVAKLAEDPFQSIEAHALYLVSEEQVAAEEARVARFDGCIPRPSSSSQCATNRQRPTRKDVMLC